jgi:succinate-acetate transporter protein
MGFATTTFVLSMYNVSARGVSTPNVVLGLAIGYGGLVQLLAGMWEFAVGNTFGATAFSSYGGFWISFGFLYSECSSSLLPLLFSLFSFVVLLIRSSYRTV